MTEVVVGLDLGTGGVRAIAVDLQGQIVAQTTRSYPLFTPQPGWTEQNPSDWVEAGLNALFDIAQQLDGKRAIALGLSGQMHGMVPLDAEGKVIRPAILWNDQRTGKAVDLIEATIPRQELIQRTGNPAITGFQLPKIVWLRTEEPEAYARLWRVLLPKDYLGYVLTGKLFTEPSDASGVGCLNLASRQWDRDILSVLNIDPSLFPSVIESTAIAGRLKADIAVRVGLPTELPVIPGGGDNAAAAIGLGISSSNLNRGSLSIGTSGVIFAPCDRPIPDPEGRGHLFCHVDGGYHLLGVTLAAGGSVRWYRDTFAPNLSYTDLMTMAQSSVSGARGILFLPHLSGERSPHLDPDTRGGVGEFVIGSCTGRSHSCCSRGCCLQLTVGIGNYQPDGSCSSTLGNRWRCKIDYLVANFSRCFANRTCCSHSRRRRCLRSRYSSNGGGQCIPRHQSCT